MITAILLIFLVKVSADECGNRCTSSQVCDKNDGICRDKSELISCKSVTSIFTTYYCKKDQDCCYDGCMPKGSVCCITRYCASNHTCCSIIGCCPQGTFCSGLNCIPDIFSTKRPSTASPRPTYFRTTSRPITHYPTRRSNSNTASDSASTIKPWHIATIATSVIFGIVVAVVIVCLIRRSQRNRSNLQGQYGRNGIVLNRPAHPNGQANVNSVTRPSEPAQTKSPSQHTNGAYISTKQPTVTNSIASSRAEVNKDNNNKKMQSFSL